MENVLDLYQGENYGIIKLNNDTKIACHGNVKARQILCECNMHLTITGDSLTVEYDKNGIAIGADAEWGLSYGRYYFPDASVTFTIDVKEIHCHSMTAGCGIGAYATYAVQSSDFTDNCIVRDTPIDMVIYNEPLQGSTKHSALPKYFTSGEAQLRESKLRNAIEAKLLFHKAIQPLVTLFTDEMNAFATMSDARKLKDIETYKAVKTFVSKLTRETYAEGLQRIFVSFVKALYDGDFFCPSQFRHIAGNIAYTCLAQELKLFDKVAAYPLALRYYLVIYDLTDNDFLEKEDESNISSFSELSLDDTLLDWYNHPKDLNYGEECKRYLYGENIYADVSEEELHALVVPDVQVNGYRISSSNVHFIPRLRWGYSSINLNYKGFAGSIALLNFKSSNELDLQILPKEDSVLATGKTILVGFDSVVTDIFSLFS